MIEQLIESYHRQKTLPVFTRRTHHAILGEFIDGYAVEGLPALERFAAEHGFLVAATDWGFRYTICPRTEPDEYAEWPKHKVPVEKAPA